MVNCVGTFLIRKTVYWRLIDSPRQGGQPRSDTVVGAVNCTREERAQADLFPGKYRRIPG